MKIRVLQAPTMSVKNIDGGPCGGGAEGPGVPTIN
jgi:hypothetical protein